LLFFPSGPPFPWGGLSHPKNYQILMVGFVWMVGNRASNFW
jgi:hypothetical protein